MSLICLMLRNTATKPLSNYHCLNSFVTGKALHLEKIISKNILYLWLRGRWGEICFFCKIFPMFKMVLCANFET